MQTFWVVFLVVIGFCFRMRARTCVCVECVRCEESWVASCVCIRIIGMRYICSGLATQSCIHRTNIRFFPLCELISSPPSLFLSLPHLSVHIHSFWPVAIATGCQHRVEAIQRMNRENGYREVSLSTNWQTAKTVSISGSRAKASTKRWQWHNKWQSDRHSTGYYYYNAVAYIQQKSSHARVLYLPDFPHFVTNSFLLVEKYQLDRVETM